jgi:hypothetical protein
LLGRDPLVSRAVPQPSVAIDLRAFFAHLIPNSGVDAGVFVLEATVIALARHSVLINERSSEEAIAIHIEPVKVDD